MQQFMTIHALPVHQTRLAIISPDPIEVQAGMPLTVEVGVSCAAGCDLSGRLVTLSTHDSPLLESHAAAGGNGRFIATFTLAAPRSAGDYEWTIQTPRVESSTAVHEESAPQRCAVKVVPHSTSLAVWDVTSPVPVLGTLRLKAGAKCSASCPLAGRRIEVCNDQGTVVGEAELRDTVLAATDALYWTDIELQAPDVQDVLTWCVALKADDLELPHDAAIATFSFRTDPPAEHRVTVELVGKDDQAPIDDAEVRLGHYAGASNAQGLAVFHLPAGSYDLTTRKDGYETAPLTVVVGEEMTVRVEAARTLTQAEREERLASFVDIEWG
jgi:hypothetical protein